MSTHMSIHMPSYISTPKSAPCRILGVISVHVNGFRYACQYAAYSRMQGQCRGGPSVNPFSRPSRRMPAARAEALLQKVVRVVPMANAESVLRGHLQRCQLDADFTLPATHGFDPYCFGWADARRQMVRLRPRP